jgi:hypothetical protein
MSAVGRITSSAAAQAQPTCSRSRAKPIAAAVAPARAEQDPVLEGRRLGRRPPTIIRCSLRPRHRDQTGADRARDDQAGGRGGLADLVAESDAGKRQRENHCDLTETRARRQQRRSDAEQADRGDGESGDLGQQSSDQHRHPR